MKASCNGCRVLRKGCSDDCVIRPSLTWIANPDHQANATLFLAKFYGRAGLLNLLSTTPVRHCPDVFRSLLYEACGRIVNPTYGSVGLLWSGKWKLCQAAVEAILRGAPVMQMAPDTAATVPLAPHVAFDIRHVPKDEGARRSLHKVTKTTQFKRVSDPVTHLDFTKVWEESARDSVENKSVVSIETVEVTGNEWRWSGDDGKPVGDRVGHGRVKLDLGLSLGL